MLNDEPLLHPAPIGTKRLYRTHGAVWLTPNKRSSNPAQQPTTGVDLLGYLQFRAQGQSPGGTWGQTPIIERFYRYVLHKNRGRPFLVDVSYCYYLFNYMRYTMWSRGIATALVEIWG
jgi:hypothetical protein